MKPYRARLASLRRSLFAAVFAALLVAVPNLGTVYAAPAPAPSASPKAEAPEPPVYTAFIKDPTSLGFKPDADLYAQVLKMVEERHPDNAPPEKLFAGVAKETGQLLKEARISDDALKAMPRDASIAENIQKAYGSKIDPNLLWFAEIRGLLGGTGDPYSVLMPPKEFNMMMERLRDTSFGGVGTVIELDKDNKNQLTVVEPIDGSPAAKAGLQAGDVIFKIDGKPTVDMPIDTAVANIRGKIGTTVTLTIHRKGQAPKDYSITRATIQVPTVTSKMLPDRIGYIRLRVFGEKTVPEFGEALDALNKQGARGIIVDLRNNGGGFLTAATGVCSHFIEAGDVVTFTKDKAEKRRNEVAETNMSRIKVPVVLLVNQFSASASEITAGCLKDNHAATLIGVKTFGKGSVQQIFPLQSDAALKLTIAHFFTPQGHAINKIGVQPDIKVEMEARYVGNNTGKDTQLQAAVDYLLKAK